MWFIATKTEFQRAVFYDNGRALIERAENLKIKIKRNGQTPVKLETGPAF